MNRLLDKDDGVVARQAGEQMLRPLENELPAQVGKDDHVGHAV
jgi:hypothetical protein